MKKLFVTAVMAIVGMGAMNAQQTTFGATAGYLNATAKIDVDGEGSLSESASGFYIGAVADIALDESFHLQPEVLYGNVEDGSVLFVPVLVKYYISESGFHLLAGPQATIDLEESGDGYNSLGVDASFGAGFDINENFFIDARYSLELTNRFSDAPDGVSGKINTLNIGVGYKF